MAFTGCKKPKKRNTRDRVRGSEPWLREGCTGRYRGGVQGRSSSAHARSLVHIGPGGKDYGYDGFHVSGTLDKRPDWLLDHGWKILAGRQCCPGRSKILHSAARGTTDTVRRGAVRRHGLVIVSRRSVIIGSHEYNRAHGECAERLILAINSSLFFFLFFQFFWSRCQTPYRWFA